MKGKQQIKPSVLIVDDEKIICEGLTRLLSDDYITYQAHNGIEAIDVLSKHQNIDVVLCDIKMPGMDGNEVIEQVRDHNKDIIMIIITAFSNPLKVCDAMKKGANHFFLKPLDIPLLEQSIKNAVMRKRPSGWNTV